MDDQLSAIDKGCVDMQCGYPRRTIWNAWHVEIRMKMKRQTCRRCLENEENIASPVKKVELNLLNSLKSRNIYNILS